MLYRSYNVWPHPYRNIDQLREQSAKRVSASEKFKELKDVALKAQERRDQSKQTLQLAKIIQEREELQKLQVKETASPHGGLIPEGEEDETVNKKSLKEQLQDDPYVLEAEQLLLAARIAQ